MRTADLAQLRELGIEINQSAFQHLAVAWVMRGLELIEHALPGQHQSLAFSLFRGLLGC